MQISVNAVRCSGHGRCYDLSPQVYASDQEGHCAQKGETFDVAEEHSDAARTGAAACPEAAIAVHE